MAECVSIKERLERQVAELLAGLSGVGTVHRWTGLGTPVLADGDAVVVPGDERVVAGEQGNIGSTLKTLTLVVGVVVFQSEADAGTTPSCTLLNRWQARLERLFTAAGAFREARSGGDDLLRGDSAIVAGVVAPDIADGLMIAAVRLELTYEHDYDNPCQGPGIAPLEDPD